MGKWNRLVILAISIVVIGTTLAGSKKIRSIDLYKFR